jgi:hypothetical protein
LLKALFVNSAVPVRALRLEEKMVKLYHPPDLVQGHGRIKIDAVLDFEGKFSLFLADQEVLASGQSRSYYFAIPPAAAAEDPEKKQDEQEGHGGKRQQQQKQPPPPTSPALPLQVTLAWIDPPNAFTAQKQLLHDLDLHVVDPRGTIFYPNGLPGPDEKNNVEKVVIYDPLPGGIYTLVVTAGELSEAEEQKYALVASADGRALAEEEALGSLGQQQQEGEEEGKTAVAGEAQASANSSLSLPPQVSLDQMLHSCYKDCLVAAAASMAKQNEGEGGEGEGEGFQGGDPLCQQFSSVIANCSAGCPPSIALQTQELCLSSKCHFRACNVSEDEAMRASEAQRFKVALRIILRGMYTACIDIFLICMMYTYGFYSSSFSFDVHYTGTYIHTNVQTNMHKHYIHTHRHPSG